MHGLQQLLALLSDLPPEADSGYAQGGALPAQMADALRSWMDTDPLLRSSGRSMDRAVLFNTVGATRTRISVLNLVGLPSLQQRQAFIAQLSMGRFSWIRMNPAGDQTLRGLLVIDEAKDFVPSRSSVASKDALLRLARQGRKYGLGLVFATQEPRNIDHAVINNCTTQLFGEVSSPTSVDVVREQLRLRGAEGQDISKLPRGQSYFYTEGLAGAVKIQRRLCLSHHPSSPLSEAEVLELAAASRGAADDEGIAQALAREAKNGGAIDQTVDG
ncbi:MAG: ATP-binding protein, partial [Polyangiaceae bacterium]|nr:ATP-binding protein [Polyangiaceae bacterium]